MHILSDIIHCATSLLFFPPVSLNYHFWAPLPPKLSLIITIVASHFDIFLCNLLHLLYFFINIAYIEWYHPLCYLPEPPPLSENDIFECALRLVILITFLNLQTNHYIKVFYVYQFVWKNHFLWPNISKTHSPYCKNFLFGIYWYQNCNKSTLFFIKKKCLQKGVSL